MRRWLVGVGTLAAAGCVQGKLDVPDFELTDWADTIPNPTLDDATLTDTLDPTVITVTTTQGMSVSSTSVGSTDDSTGDDTTSTTTGDEPVCEPAPESIQTTLMLDGRPAWEHEPTQSTSSCLVSWVGALGAALHVGLACEDGPHALDVTRVGPTALEVGDLVELSIDIAGGAWTDMLVAVRRDGELMIAAMSGERLPGDGEPAPPSEFFAPLFVALLDEVCSDEYEELEDDCALHLRRHAIAFIDDDDVEVVFDRGTSEIGRLAIAVGDARKYYGDSCPEVPPSWYAFVAVRGD
jgi:hypothetical protein